MNRLPLLGLLLGGLLALPAGANMTYTLNVDGCSGGCGTAPFATINLTQASSAIVHVTETLLQGDKYVGTGAGEALAFNILGNPVIAILNLTAGFSIGPAPSDASTFGAFNYSVTCSGCGSGASNPLPGPLEFDVQLDGIQPLSVTSFIANGLGYFFASDIAGNNTKTGNVAAKDAPVELVPEPFSLLLVGTGLLSLGLVRSRVKR